MTSALDPSSWSTFALSACYAAAAGVVWIAGTRLAHQADAIVRRTSADEGVVGVLLLAGVTSLPEIAVTVTASARGHAPMAVDNLLGSIAMQVTVLAVADAVIGRRALSAVVANPATLVQGTFCVLLLALVAVAATSGDRRVLGVGAWALLLGVLYAVALRIVARAAKSPGWEARTDPDAGVGGERPPPHRDGANEDRRSGRALALATAGTGLAILVAGYVLSRSAEVLADRTGLGTRFVGVTLLAAATSLPEVSSVVSATRLGRYAMAAGDIFGTNLANVALILLVDAVSPGPPVLGELGPFSVVAALLGIVLTTFYLVGFIERRDRTLWRMGLDSVAALVTYAGGVALLFHLR